MPPRTPSEEIREALHGVWEREHGGHLPDEFWNTTARAVNELLGDDAPDAWHIVLFGGEEWLFVIVREKAHLLRPLDDRIEVRYLGALAGGAYRETVGHQRRSVTFEHPPLPSPLELVAGTPQEHRFLDELRPFLRAWAEGL